MMRMNVMASQFNPGAFSDTPLYNIQAVAAATGVPSITLRSWERRYGIPEPKRDPKGYRLYSQRDIAITRWLHERVQEGVGISRAVNLLKVLELREAEAPHRATFDFESLQARLLDAIDAMDEEEVGRVIGDSLMVATVEEVGIKLLQPALYEMGDRWAGGKLSVTTEHVSSNLIRSQLAQLARISPPPIREETIFVACAPGEFHDIGALMLALFLRRRGFRVVYGGANVEADSFIADVLRVKPSAICMSASSAQAANALKEVFQRLEDSYGGLLAYGGRAFNTDEHLRDAVPGVYLGVDALEGTANVEAALKRL
jgi:methanogenic corrinoid protein MtbC1